MEEEFKDLEDLISTEGEDLDVSKFQVELSSDPYWRVDRKRFQQVLKVVGDISARNSDAVSKSILLRTKGDFLYLVVTNKDIFFQCRLPLVNQESRLQDSVILDSRQLHNVSKFSNDVILFKDVATQKWSSMLMSGKYIFDVFAFQQDIFKIEEKSPQAMKEVDPAFLKAEMSLMYNLMSLATLAEDKRVIVVGGKAYGSLSL